MECSILSINATNDTVVRVARLVRLNFTACYAPFSQQNRRQVNSNFQQYKTHYLPGYLVNTAVENVGTSVKQLPSGTWRCMRKE